MADHNESPQSAPSSGPSYDELLVFRQENVARHRIDDLRVARVCSGHGIMDLDGRPYDLEALEGEVEMQMSKLTDLLEKAVRVALESKWDSVVQKLVENNIEALGGAVSRDTVTQLIEPAARTMLQPVFESTVVSIMLEQMNKFLEAVKGTWRM